jgi:hypothetical protein
MQLLLDETGLYEATSIVSFTNSNTEFHSSTDSNDKFPGKFLIDFTVLNVLTIFYYTFHCLLYVVV